MSEFICRMVDSCLNGTSDLPPIENSGDCKHTRPHEEAQSCGMGGGCWWTDELDHGKDRETYKTLERRNTCVEVDNAESM
jgi:hypothetical protein